MNTGDTNSKGARSPIAGAVVSQTLTSNDTEVKRSAPTRNLDMISTSDVASGYAKKVPRSVLIKVVETVNVILELFFIHGLHRPSTRPEDEHYYRKFHKSVLKTTERILQHHIDTAALDSWIKYWKYKTNAFFAYWEGQELPPVLDDLKDDHPGFLFGGIIGQWVRSKCNLESRSPLILGVLMAKKGMPRADEELCRAAEIKTVKALTTAREQRKPVWSRDLFSDEWVEKTYSMITGTRDFNPGRPSLLTRREAYALLVGDIGTEWEQTSLPMLSILAPSPSNVNKRRLKKYQAMRQLRRTVQELFKGKTFGISDMSVPVFPSTSSNYNNTRGRGGGVGHLLEKMIRDQYQHELADSFTQTMKVFFDRQTELHGERGVLDQETIEPLESKEKICYEFNPKQVTQLFRRFYWSTFQAALLEEPLVKAVALPEALKIRVISKGPPCTYFVLKSFQKFLWGVLKNHPTFRLIGKPVEVDDIIEICGSDENMFKNSGDFQASTDNLYSWVSETILDELGQVLNLPPQLLELAKRALTLHIFEDESLEGGRAEQKTGQLMGSIISFPFLCVANASACRWALELSERRCLTLRQSRILINGDDNLIATLQEDYHEIWKNVCSLHGLDSSPGKTYFTKKFAVINSVHYDQIDGSWVERKYVNMGLVRGLKRSVACGPVKKEGSLTPEARHRKDKPKPKKEEKSLLDISSAYNALKKSTPKELWGDVARRFFYHNSNDLKRFKGSYWLPRYAGGLGMEADELSYHDRQVLTNIQVGIAEGRVPQSLPLDKEWDTWEVAHNELLRACPLLHKQSFKQVFFNGEIDLEEENAEIIKLVVLSAMFNYSLDKLFPKVKRNPMRREAQVLKHNSLLFQEAARRVSADTRAVPMEDVYGPDIQTYYNLIHTQIPI